MDNTANFVQMAEDPENPLPPANYTVSHVDSVEAKPELDWDARFYFLELVRIALLALILFVMFGLIGELKNIRESIDFAVHVADGNLVGVRNGIERLTEHVDCCLGAPLTRIANVLAPVPPPKPVEPTCITAPQDLSFRINGKLISSELVNNGKDRKTCYVPNE